VATKIWWCDNCGYETEGRGRCPECGERLLPSALPALEAGVPEQEVGYGLADWSGRARGRLIEAMIDASVLHRFEDEELVVRASDENVVDELTEAILARKVWWCRNCGYEALAEGRCEDCGEDLVVSPLPELETPDDHEEVTYSLSEWDNPMRVQLIQALIDAKVPHRLEEAGDGYELVVRPADETATTHITGIIFDAANPKPVRRHKDLSNRVPSQSSITQLNELPGYRGTTGQPSPPALAPESGQADTWSQRPPPTLQDDMEALQGHGTWGSVTAAGVSTWAPLWLSLLVFAPIGFVMSIWRLAKHYGAHREVVALVVSSAQLLVFAVLVIVAVAAPPPRPANGGFYNTTVLAASVQRVTNQHYAKLGMGITVTEVACVLDYGSTFTCALHEKVDGVSSTVPVTVVVSKNGNEWKSS